LHLDITLVSQACTSRASSAKSHPTAPTEH